MFFLSCSHILAEKIILLDVKTSISLIYTTVTLAFLWQKRQKTASSKMGMTIQNRIFVSIVFEKSLQN
jgi:hypothetical protein